MYLALCLSALASSTVVSGQTGWVQVRQDLPKEALAATPLGPKPETDVLHITVALPYRDPAGVRAFVNSVSDPSSPHYRQFITPDQVGVRFGLPATQVQWVANYLASQGMRVKLVGKNRLSVLADATVAQAEHAFNVKILNYMATLPGRPSPTTCFSSTTPPSVPAALGSAVNYIGGLENFVRPTPAQALTPDQFRTLYSVSPLYQNSNQGQGRTVAISNWTTYGLFNIPLEYTYWNLPTPPGGVGSNVTVESIDGSNGETSGPPQVECDIDIQTVLAMAPLCHLILYDNAANSDILGVLTQEADDNKADLITESYAWNGPTPMFVAAHNLHLAMSAQGITYLCASGDWGSGGMANLYYPDEDPEVCSVGGTSVETDTLGNRVSEVVWEGASGGGWAPNTDPFNLLPTYQTGTGVPTDIPYRLVPDMALDADPGTGYEVFLQGGLQEGWGGTSCASPSVAGDLATCEGAIIAGGGLPPDAAGHQRFGRIQDLLYSFNGDSTVFYDITSGSNGTLPNGEPSNATAGWDTATGWGTMIFSGFVAKVLSYPAVSSIKFSSASLAGGASTTGTIRLTSRVGVSSATVYLNSSNAAVTVPTSISVAKGASSGTFQVNTAAVSAQMTVTVTAALAGSEQSAKLTVDPLGVQTLSLFPTSVIGGSSASGTVSLSGPAGPGGTAVTLASSYTGAIVPASLPIAAGASSATFSVTTVPQLNTVPVTISAGLGTSVQSTVLTVNALALASLSVSPNPTPGGTAITGTVALNGPAPPSGMSVSLSSSNIKLATVPASITVAGGDSSASFEIGSSAVAKAQTVTIAAALGSVVQRTALQLQPPALVSLTVAPASVQGSSTTAVTGVVMLSGPAGAPVLVKISSSNTSAATVPATVIVRPGKTSATFKVSHKKVKVSAAVTISATLSQVSETAKLTVTP